MKCKEHGDRYIIFLYRAACEIDGKNIINRKTRNLIFFKRTAYRDKLLSIFQCYKRFSYQHLAEDPIKIRLLSLQIRCSYRWYENHTQ